MWACGVTLSWSMEANSGVRDRIRAAQKTLEGMTDRQTDRQTHTRSVHYMMITTVLCLKKPNSSLPMLAKL